MTESEEEPACYRSLEGILEVVANKQAYDPIVRFLRNNKLFQESEADYAASLIILKQSARWRIRADLNASHDLETLPLIRRTGRSSPWMRCYMLGLEGEVVTDVDLQRAKCLFLSKEAAAQEWINLLIRVLRMVQIGAPFDADEFRSMGGDFASQQTLEQLTRLIEKHITASNGGALPNPNLRDEILHFLNNSRELRGPSIEKYVDWQLKNLEAPQLPEVPIPFDPYLLKNLFITLKLGLGDEPFDRRHLGEARLDRINKTSAYNLVIQGAGDLSMNEWNLAFYHDPESGSPRIVIPENEPFGSRKYNCLVVWRDDHHKVRTAVKHIAEKGLGTSLGLDVSITQLQFAKGDPHIRLPESYSWNTLLPHAVNFALYGKLVLRDGEVVEPDEVIDEFQDLRHVFVLPNLNPERCDRVPNLNADLIADWINRWRDGEDKVHEQFRRVIDHLGAFNRGEKTALDLMDLAGKIWQRSLIEGEQGSLYAALENLRASLDSMGEFLMTHFSELRDLFKRPRHLFGQPQTTDVWLLEHVLLEDRSLRHLACKSTIAVDLADLGAPQAWIDYCLLESGYRKCEKLHHVQERGDFAWDDADHPRLLIRLKFNTYPCTMVGLGNLSDGHDRGDECGALYLLAWGHDFGKGGHTIWDCARVMKAVGARYALVIDEGQDTFQCHIPGQLWFNRGDFQSHERDCQRLDQWMPVPLAFEDENVDNPPGARKIKRRGLRASLAFWQTDSSTRKVG